MFDLVNGDTWLCDFKLAKILKREDEIPVETCRFNASYRNGDPKTSQ
jgi:hypothetical protein